ncbi:predicted protein [Methanosarcina acetivorans C2A]|uniref:Uncharacterized protein n=1 Tax=Methanosarcina acetivorans (strain ATCC 35395 / DSM 2834 / JCM 12185 / C2A) TaxID=188937 RepID=Q8TJK9_METAC|nr:predicted protein [Methanosarcina acetivorans C2A]
MKSKYLISGKDIFHVVLTLNNKRFNLVRDINFPFKDIYRVFKEVRKQCLKYRNYATSIVFCLFLVLFISILEYYFKIRTFGKEMIVDEC